MRQEAMHKCAGAAAHIHAHHAGSSGAAGSRPMVYANQEMSVSGGGGGVQYAECKRAKAAPTAAAHTKARGMAVAARKATSRTALGSGAGADPGSGDGTDDGAPRSERLSSAMAHSRA